MKAWGLVYITGVLSSYLTDVLRLSSLTSPLSLYLGRQSCVGSGLHRIYLQIIFLGFGAPTLRQPPPSSSRESMSLYQCCLPQLPGPHFKASWTHSDSRIQVTHGPWRGICARTAWEQCVLLVRMRQPGGVSTGPHSVLCRPSDRRLSAKLVPIFVRRGVSPSQLGKYTESNWEEISFVYCKVQECFG
jgi:hypothetical protein